MRSRQDMNRSVSSTTAWLAGVLIAVSTSGVRAQEPAPGEPTPQAAASAVPVTPAAVAAVQVRLQTVQGDIVLALDPEHAPVTTANFLHYVDQKRFDGAQFYRAVVIGDDGQYGLLQGGLFGTRAQPFKPIAHEAPAVTGLHHVDGAVSMARGEPGSAQSEFFIVVGDLLDYDGRDGDPGYAVFGHVASGMDVVKRLLAMPRSADAGGAAFHGQMLASPVKIISARRVAASGKP
jgi:peptidyl-prolyl cis-trans isomerase A (cyclophilin A)